MSELEMDYDDNDVDADKTDEPKITLKSIDVRRKIEDMLERKRLREEFGDMAFD